MKFKFRIPVHQAHLVADLTTTDYYCVCGVLCESGGGPGGELSLSESCDRIDRDGAAAPGLNTAVTVGKYTLHTAAHQLITHGRVPAWGAEPGH